MPPDVLRADTAVIGLGSVGVMAAWQLATEPGHRVIGFDQHGRVHAHAGYAGESRLFRVAYHEGSHYVPILRWSHELWQQLADESGLPLFRPTGTLSIAQRGSPQLNGVLASIRDFGLPHEVLEGDALARRFPQHACGPDDLGVIDRLGGALRPELAISAAHQAAVDRGAQLLTGEKVLGLDDDGEKVTIRTTRRTTIADRVVVAIGAWTGKLIPRAPVLVKRLLLTWFLPRRLDDFRPDVFPVFLRDRGDDHIFGAPTLDELGVKVSTTDRWGLADDPDPITARQLSEFGALVADLLPGLYPDPIRYSIHRDGYTASRTPIVDFAGASRRVLVATGFSGHGFKMSPAIGRLAADLVRGDLMASPFPWPPTTAKEPTQP